MTLIVNGDVLPIIMSYNINDYYEIDYSRDFEYATTSNTKIMFYEYTKLGERIYTIYEGTGLLGNNPRITDCTIGPEDYMLIGWGDLSLSIDEFNSKILNADSFANGSILAGADRIGGTKYDDELIGRTGKDWFNAYGGNDIIRAGNGADLITGGTGSDTLYGGFGKNSFFDNRDGSVDTIYLKSDQFAYNYIYGKAGNSPNGEKIDGIYNADSYDKIIIQGVKTSELTVGNYLGDIGIFANGYVEATYLGGDLSINQVAGMVSGDLG